jgi:hypothetical protein
MTRSSRFCSVLCVLSFCRVGAGEPVSRQVGVAKVDVTPDYPVRLTGYAVRTTESAGVAQHLYARALAFGSDNDKPAILITVDNCGVPKNVRDEVTTRLSAKRRIQSERLAICSTHTHCGPWVKGFAPNIFGAPVPPDQQARVDRYTRDLTDALERAAVLALDDRHPAQINHGLTQADFAANRRTKGGPVDHDLPVLLVTAPDGSLRAVFTSYACHGTTLVGDFNQCCGDWPGYAAEDIEAAHPGAIALVGLGCAGDANPAPRGTLDLAKQHGQEIAAAVQELLTERQAELLPVTGRLGCHARQLELPFDTLPTRAEWEALAKETNYAGGHARLNLARLDRGEKLPTSIPYMVQTWTFGNDLAMVFLSGEVVVDYSLRLKREFDSSRLWINAYANDVPCYIPSERILKEGGYEGGGAMIFYDKPTRLAPGLEDHIVAAVRQLLPRRFRSDRLP